MTPRHQTTQRLLQNPQRTALSTPKGGFPRAKYDSFVLAASFQDSPSTNTQTLQTNHKKAQTMSTDTSVPNTITRADFLALTAQVKHLGDCMLVIAAAIDGIDSDAPTNITIEYGVNNTLSLLKGIKDPASVKKQPLATVKI